MNSIWTRKKLFGGRSKKKKKKTLIGWRHLKKRSAFRLSRRKLKRLRTGVSKQTESRRRGTEKLHPLQIHFPQTAKVLRGKPFSGSASPLAAQHYCFGCGQVCLPIMPRWGSQWRRCTEKNSAPRARRAWLLLRPIEKRTAPTSKQVLLTERTQKKTTGFSKVDLKSYDTRNKWNK